MKTLDRAPSAVVALIGMSAYFGLTPVLARYLSTGLGVYEQWYLRFAIAFVVATVVFRRHIHFEKFRHLPRREWLLLLARVFSGSVVAVALYTLASQRAKVGPVSFMQGVPLLPVFGVLLMHESLNRRKLAFILLSFVGIGLVAIENPHDILSFNVGEVYSLISWAFFAFTFITRKWHSDLLNNQEIAVAMLGLSFILDYALSLALYHRAFAHPAQWTVQFVAVLVFAGLAAAASLLLQNYGFQHIDGVVAGSLLNLEQVFGPVFGFVFYKEGLAAHELVGGVCIVAAALGMNRLHAAAKPQPVPSPEINAS